VSYLLAFLGFAALIVLHEFGHFTAAKAVGMRVERFSLFFGPLLVRFRRGETEYGIGPIPAGGYVRITGMNPKERMPEEDQLDALRARREALRIDGGTAQEEHELDAQISELDARLASIRPRAYHNQPVWKRVVVILAGPAVNLVLAFLILWVILLAQGEAVAGVSKQVALVEKATPAAAVLKTGDRIISVDGVSGSAEALQRQIRSHRCAGVLTNGCVAATPVKVVAKRGQRDLSFEIRPRYVAKDGHMEIGFAFAEYSKQHPVTAGHAASLTATGLWNVTTLTVSKFATLFEPQSRKSIHSVVGAFKVTQQRFAFSATEAFETLALISLSLGVINLFPFLPLDGGHVFWALAEKARGKRIPVEVMERAGAVGFALILIIFVIGLSNDISTLTGSGFNVH
jgi:regulator of sigma E protease